MARTPATNTLYYGDNLDILREYVDEESVDLVYLDRRSIPTRPTTCCSRRRPARACGATARMGGLAGWKLTAKKPIINHPGHTVRVQRGSLPW
jgi:hypothetical protein